jgi:DNA polymerase-3 subunit alpha
VEDVSGKCDAVVFPSTYEEVAALLVPDTMVFLQGSLDRKRERPSILVDEVIPIDEAIEKFTGGVTLRLPAGKGNGLLKDIRNTISAHRGNCPLYVEVSPAGRVDVRAKVQVDREWFVSPSRETLTALEDILGGQEFLSLTGRAVVPNGRSRRGNWNPNQRSHGQQGVVSEAVTRFN